MTHKNTFKFILLVILIFIAAIFVAKSNISVADMKDSISAYESLAPMAFLLSYLLGTIAFIPATPFDLLAGALFGLFWGFVLVMLGSIIVSTLTFFIARYLGQDFIEKIIKNNFKTINHYKESIENHGFKAVVILRLIPVLPFNVLNLVIGITKIKFKDYFWGTTLGIMPIALVYVYFGESLASSNMAHIVISIILISLILVSSYLTKRSRRFQELFRSGQDTIPSKTVDQNKKS